MMRLRKTFLNLPARAQYEVLGAIRGPDDTNNVGLVLKRVVTARLRWFVFEGACAWGARAFKPMYSGALMQRHHLDEVRTALGVPAGIDWHYRIHLAQALLHCYRNAVWNGHGAELLTLLARNSTVVVRASALIVKHREQRKGRRRAS